MDLKKIKDSKFCFLHESERVNFVSAVTRRKIQLLNKFLPLELCILVLEKIVERKVKYKELLPERINYQSVVKERHEQQWNMSCEPLLPPVKVEKIENFDEKINEFLAEKKKLEKENGRWHPVSLETPSPLQAVSTSPWTSLECSSKINKFATDSLQEVSFEEAFNYLVLPIDSARKIFVKKGSCFGFSL